MLADDDAVAAAQQAGSWSDDRVQHWWDEDKEMSRLFAQTLSLQGPAWDVYLLYSPGISWEEEVPPVPSFWMHQLSDPAAALDRYLRRDPSRLARELDRLILDRLI
jgi:hypothetical protein